MTPAQYHDALARLDLTQVAAARLVGIEGVASSGEEGSTASPTQPGIASDVIGVHLGKNSVPTGSAKVSAPTTNA
jgi:hypothetical protein